MVTTCPYDSERLKEVFSGSPEKKAQEPNQRLPGEKNSQYQYSVS
jgi:hypothetical protein